MQVPAAVRTLRVLRALAAASGPMTAQGIAAAIGAPRSSTYHLLQAMASEGFVLHFPEEERWGLGVGAFEIGAAYLRHDPLERMAGPLVRKLARDAGATPSFAHLGVLHGRETLYLAKAESRRRLVNIVEVGVRLPAPLTASGRAMLAEMPAAQVRALFPDARAFVDRTGTGPGSLAALQQALAEVRRSGCAHEEGFIDEALSSVAAAALDRDGHPAASLGLTFARDTSSSERARIEKLVLRAARELTTRLRGKPLAV